MNGITELDIRGAKGNVGEIVGLPLGKPIYVSALAVCRQE